MSFSVSVVSYFEVVVRMETNLNYLHCIGGNTKYFVANAGKQIHSKFSHYTSLMHLKI